MDKKELQERITNAIVLLTNGHSFKVGDLTFQSRKNYFSVTGWTLKNDLKNITKKTVVSGSIPVVAGGLKPAYYHNCHNVTAPAITISASGANAGFVNLYHQNIWASDCSFVNEEETQYIYSIYLFFKSRQDEITKMQQGAAQPHVYPKDLSRIVLVDPPKEIWMKFEKSISSFFKKIKNNTNETLNLKNLRDGLLPKLLSGEVTINDLEAKR